MKNTMFATLVALVAGCGLVHADEPGGRVPRYYGNEAPPPPRVSERVVVDETIDRHPVGGCFPGVPFCANENTICVLRPGPNEFTGTIALYSTHDDPRGPGFELRGPDVPGHALLRDRIARLQVLGYCPNLPSAGIPTGPVGPEGVPPVNAGPAWIGR